MKCWPFMLKSTYRRMKTQIEGAEALKRIDAHRNVYAELRRSRVLIGNLREIGLIFDDSASASLIPKDPPGNMMRWCVDRSGELER